MRINFWKCGCRQLPPHADLPPFTPGAGKQGPRPFRKATLAPPHMQRRAGKGMAIAPPIGQYPSMPPSSEKASRLNQRSFGVTNRIWVIVFVFLFLIAFTNYILPSHHAPQPRFNYPTSGLKSKNYLNKTQVETEPNPFDFCPVFGPGDKIGTKYGALTLSQSRLHLGSGGRVQRVIHKALLGQPVTISVLGGSGEP